MLDNEFCPLFVLFVAIEMRCGMSNWICLLPRLSGSCFEKTPTFSEKRWRFFWFSPTFSQKSPLFNPNRSLASEQISLDCWADCFSFVRRRSGLQRERTRNKRLTRIWKMTECYLLHDELHYNGLMIDWGLMVNLRNHSHSQREKTLQNDTGFWTSILEKVGDNL